MIRSAVMSEPLFKAFAEDLERYLYDTAYGSAAPNYFSRPRQKNVMDYCSHDHTRDSIQLPFQSKDVVDPLPGSRDKDGLLGDRLPHGGSEAFRREEVDPPPRQLFEVELEAHEAGFGVSSYFLRGDDVAGRGSRQANNMN